VLAIHPDLNDLDGALVRLRRLWDHPALRRRLLELLGVPVELSLIRTLGAIEERHAEPEPGVRHVADALAVDASTASRFVEQAVAGGWVTRRTCARDRRRCVLALTERGEGLLERVTEVRSALLAELTADWTADDIATLATLLERLDHRIQELEAAT
jgi:DNA-binding MarR family transcriptional regulator